VSDKEKLFATVVPMRGQDGEEWSYAIDVNGERLLTIGEVTDEDIDDIAGDLNRANYAAVEARDAKLRGALRAAHEAIETYLEVACDGSECQTPSHGPLHAAAQGARAALAGTGPEYVHGDIACGLAFNLGQCQSVLRDAQVVIGALDTGDPTERAVIGPFLEAMGLRKTTLADLAYDDLKAEMRRRESEPKFVDGRPISNVMKSPAFDSSCTCGDVGRYWACPQHGDVTVGHGAG
jgi:hypothetical protein